MVESSPRVRLFMYILPPAIVAAVIVLFLFVFFRSTQQLEHVRQQSVIEATLTLADEKVERLDHVIIEQDNVLFSEIDVASLHTLARQWPARETPTVSAVLIVDLSSPDREVVAFASRDTGAGADESFRRIFVHRLINELELENQPLEQLRHLHVPIRGQSYLISYWQHFARGHRFLVVARHDVPSIVRGVFPRVFSDSSAGARVGVFDEEGKYVFGTPLRSGEYTISRQFPTTLYGWRLQVALASSADLSAEIEHRRRLELALVMVACMIIVIGTGVILMAVEKERRLSMQKTEFVANVSHELKTPLALIRMFTELLSMGRAVSTEKRDEYLRIILVETERLSSLIENVLDFARLEQGRVTYDFAAVDLAELITRSVDIFKHRAEREQLEVTVDLPPALPFVRADFRMLQHALFNLLDNALKYAKDGKTIEIRVIPHRSVLEILVTDHGPGIPKEEQKRIFERFVRGKNASDNHVRGSGIGLSLVRSILSSHNGYVRVESVPGKGSTFVLAVPVAKDEMMPRADLSDL